MSLEQSMTQSQKNSFISSNKIHKGNINQVVNYMNSVRKNFIYNIIIERIYNNGPHKRKV